MLCLLGAPKLFADSSCVFQVCVLEASGLAAFANGETLRIKQSFYFSRTHSLAGKEIGSQPLQQ